MPTKKGTELFQLPGPNLLSYLHWMGLPLHHWCHQRMHSLQRVDFLDSWSRWIAAKVPQPVAKLPGFWVRGAARGKLVVRFNVLPQVLTPFPKNGSIAPSQPPPHTLLNQTNWCRLQPLQLVSREPSQLHLSVLIRPPVCQACLKPILAQCPWESLMHAHELLQTFKPHFPWIRLLQKCSKPPVNGIGRCIHPNCPCNPKSAINYLDPVPCTTAYQPFICLHQFGQEPIQLILILLPWGTNSFEWLKLDPSIANSHLAPLHQAGFQFLITFECFVILRTRIHLGSRAFHPSSCLAYPNTLATWSGQRICARTGSHCSAFRQHLRLHSCTCARAGSHCPLLMLGPAFLGRDVALSLFVWGLMFLWRFQKFLTPDRAIPHRLCTLPSLPIGIARVITNSCALPGSGILLGFKIFLQRNIGLVLLATGATWKRSPGTWYRCFLPRLLLLAVLRLLLWLCWTRRNRDVIWPSLWNCNSWQYDVPERFVRVVPQDTPYRLNDAPVAVSRLHEHAGVCIRDIDAFTQHLHRDKNMNRFLQDSRELIHHPLPLFPSCLCVDVPSS